MTEDKFSTTKLHVAITGGGTGGHVYPAIAILQELKKDKTIRKITYIGCPDSLEEECATKEGVEFFPAKASGMPRKLSFSFIKWFKELSKSVHDCSLFFHENRPDIIIGTGGYASAPALISAVLNFIPYIIHEADTRPGIVNKLMAFRASAVSVAFEGARKHLASKRIFVNGNPVRSAIVGKTKVQALKELGLSENKSVLLVMGGSQGAKKINDAMLKISEKLVNDDIQLIHQTGRKNYDDYLKQLSKQWTGHENCKNYIVKPFFEDIATPLNAADLVISRAGSLSLSELNLVGLPSILVPFPYAAADHQKHNAIFMTDKGASQLLEDKDCSAEGLYKVIKKLINDKEKLVQMKIANLEIAKKDATKNIIKLIKSIMY